MCDVQSRLIDIHDAQIQGFIAKFGPTAIALADPRGCSQGAPHKGPNYLILTYTIFETGTWVVGMSMTLAPPTAYGKSCIG